MLYILPYRIFFQILVCMVSILTCEAAYGVGPSREKIDEETSKAELHTRFKISRIIRDRYTYNAALVIHLEKHRASSRAERDDLIREINGVTYPSSLSEALFNKAYDDQIEAARYDQNTYRLLEERFTAQFEPIYTLVSLALAEVENTTNMGNAGDERYFLRRIRALAAPHVTLECQDLCKRIQWVAGQQGAYFPISIMSNQQRYLRFVNERFEENKTAFIRTSAPDEAMVRFEVIARKFRDVAKVIVADIEKYGKMVERKKKFGMDNKENLDTCIRGIEVLYELEQSLDKLTRILRKAEALSSSQGTSSTQAAFESSKKGRQKITHLASMSGGGAAAAAAPSQNNFALDPFPDLTAVTSFSSGAAAAAPTLQGSLAFAPFPQVTTASSFSSGAAAAAPTSQDSLAFAPFPQVTTVTSFSSGAAAAASAPEDSSHSKLAKNAPGAIPPKSKPSLTKESYAQRRARYNANLSQYLSLLRDVQPLGEMVTLTGRRISTLDPTSRGVLEMFVRNIHYKYEQRPFEAWIKRLGGQMKPISGSQWKVTLFDDKGDKYSASIHTPHSERFEWLDPISRSNLFFLFQQTGFIEWHR